MFTLTKPLASPPDAPSQLDPQEISVRNTREKAQEQRFRFQHFQHIRDYWLSVLPRTCLSPAKQTRFENCGTHAWVQYCPTTHEFRISSDRCKLRICPACALARSRRVADKLNALQKLPGLPPPKLLTLTLKPSARDLPDQIAYIKSCFRRLRATAFWKKTKPKGLAVIEVTRGSDGGHWHVHLHAVLRADFIDSRKLSVIWKRITCGSFIVQVKSVRPSEDLTNYLSKYLAKIPNPEHLTTTEQADEWIRAVERSHWVITVGRLPKQNPNSGDRQKKTWIHVCKLVSLIPTITTEGWRRAAEHMLAHQLALAEERTTAHVIDST